MKTKEEIFAIRLQLGQWREKAEKLIKDCLERLTYKYSYYIHAGDTHRWIESDGWYELQYELLSHEDPNFRIYLDTYSTSEQEFQDEWSTDGGRDIEFHEMCIKNDLWDMQQILTNLTENETVKKCLEEFQQDIDAVLAVDPFAADKAERESRITVW